MTALHWLLRCLLICGAALAWCAGAAMAESTLERLLMPGPVIEGHAKIENDCQACHEPFSKSTQDRLCLDCHKPIKADVAAKKGFHGRSPWLKGLACNFCHDDHTGREADVVQLNATAFDHRITDYRLEGSHRNVPCDSCHAKDKRWAEAPTACAACHLQDEPHKGNLGKKCEDCHDMTQWRNTKAFDHGATRFPLHGKHTDVPCMSCHMSEFYKGVGTACNDCHAVQDLHATRFGTACGSCHNDQAWRTAKFDHGKLTRFPLTGAHAGTKCTACHGGQVLSPISGQCIDCHEKQDIHKGSLGRDCASCHNDAAWAANIRFDHDLTRFPLTGLHVAVACEGCHQTPTYKVKETACSTCHETDDVHKGRFTAACESCHSANGWTRVSFDHDRQTRYPLTGKHKTTACYACHTETGAASARIPAACFSCHAKQDVHRGKFGTACGECHSTAAFTTAIIRRKPSQN